MLLEVFIFFFKMGAFSFGGGYAMIPLISQEVVNNKGWLTHTELVDMIAISQMTPGPIAVNLATYLGYQQAGLPGAVAGTLGVILPSFIIMSIFWILLKKLADNLYMGYFLQGLRPIVIGLVLSGLIAVWSSSIVDPVTLLIFAGAFLLIHFKEFNPILIIIIGAILGLALY